MDKATEAKQWELCGFCGAQKIPDTTVVARCIANGLSEAAAQDYAAQHAYNVCPNQGDGKHSRHTECLRMPFVDGAYYHGICRNARCARYIAEINGFIYMREKFGSVFPESISHAENDNGFDLFKPYGVLENPPFEIAIPLDLQRFAVLKLN